MRYINIVKRLLFSNFKKQWNRLIDLPDSSWLERKEPFSRIFGLDRGLAIDRRFIERFISTHKSCIHGNVLEIGDDQYTYQFGSRLNNTIIFAGQSLSNRSRCVPDGDLTKPETFSSLEKFDCVIATNVLNFIYDFKAAIKGLALLVKPDTGIALVTVAGLSQISRFDYERWGDYWRFNDMSIRLAFQEHFEDVEVVAYGNAPLAAGFIMGISQEEVPASLFEFNDPDFQILITIRASNPKSDLQTA